MVSADDNQGYKGRRKGEMGTGDVHEGESMRRGKEDLGPYLFTTVHRRADLHWSAFDCTRRMKSVAMGDRVSECSKDSV